MSQAGSLNGAGIFPPGTVVQTLTGNSGGPVGPDGTNNINIEGIGAIDVTGNPGTNTLEISLSTAVADTYDTDSGSATPALGVLNIFGDRDINTSGAGNTVTIHLDNAITLGDLVAIPGLAAITLQTGDATITAGNINLPITSSSSIGVIKVGGNSFIHSYGATNTFVGKLAGNFTLTGNSNSGFGTNALNGLTSGLNNTGIGFIAGQVISSGSNNVGIGSAALSALTTSSLNTALGVGALYQLVNGTFNIGLGYNSGSGYVGNESSNIAIGNIGVVADSGKIRIGTSGTHTATFIAGIDGVNVGSVAKVVTETSDQLGTATITAGTGITVTPTANTITIASNGTTTLTVTAVSTTPYVVLTTDQYLAVNSSGGIRQINLPNAPATGRVYIIKDSTGSAQTNNITVTTVGGAVLIDGATTFVMNTQYESVNVIFTGSAYEVY